MAIFWRFGVFAPQEPASQACSLSPCRACEGLPGGCAIGTMRLVLLEADRVCSGALGRNGGQAIAGFASRQAPFVHQLGRGDARLAWDISLEALRLIDQRMAAFSIDCDRVHSYLCVAETFGLMDGLVLVKSKVPLQRFAKAARVGMICRGYCLENVLIMRAVGDRMIIATPRVMKPGMLAGFPGESIG